MPMDAAPKARALSVKGSPSIPGLPFYGSRSTHQWLKAINTGDVHRRLHMCRKFFVVSAAAVLLASAPAALAANFTDPRDSGNSAHQTELDEQFARSHQTIIPGAPHPVTSTRRLYGYVPPHHSKAKRAHDN
jgi:hypothetical protein